MSNSETITREKPRVCAVSHKKKPLLTPLDKQ